MKIVDQKLDIKAKAKSKVGSLDNIHHSPHGGQVKIVNQKIDIQAKSKVGSLDNINHTPKGGKVKVRALCSAHSRFTMKNQN